MCNAIISNKKKDDFWVLKIKELCEREMKGGLKEDVKQDRNN